MKKEEKHTALTLIKEEEKIFLVKRKFEPLKDFWSFPGGRVEKEESVEQGAIRETKEETGIDIKIIKELKSFKILNKEKNRLDIFHIFFCKPISMKFNIDFEESLDGKWFKIKDIFNPEFKFPSRLLYYLK